MKLNSSLLKNNKILAILSVFAIILLFVSAFFLVSGFTLFNQPTPPPNIDESKLPGFPGFSNGDVSEEEIEKSTQSSLVYQMVQDLPYDGTNFALYYSYDNDSFTLYLSPGNEAAGRAEFSNFINSKGVQDASWIHNLNETSVKPTPEP